MPDGLRPIEAGASISARCPASPTTPSSADGFRVVTTLAQGETGTPIRFVSVLAPGQTCRSLNAAPGRCARNQPGGQRSAGPQGGARHELRFEPSGRGNFRRPL